MKKVGMILIILFFNMNVMAECTTEINKEFLSIQNNPPYNVNRLESIYNACPEAPIEMLLHLAKGDAFERNGEVEFALGEYKKARSKYAEIDDSQISMYNNFLDVLEEKIEKYSPTRANVIERSMTMNSRGAGLTTEYKIEDLPLNFQSDSHEIKKGVNLTQAEEIYKVLSSKKYRGKSIRIMGYTDTSGEPSHNEKLSENRANSLAKYLKRKGLTNKIKYDGKGESKPICAKGEIVRQKNSNFKCSIKEDKYRSRRVDITIGDE